MEIREARVELEKDSDFVISRTRASAARKAGIWRQEAPRLQMFCSYLSYSFVLYIGISE